jgi:hypothetical protein
MQSRCGRWSRCFSSLCAEGALAFVLDIGILAELVSVGTLYVFYSVCCGVLYRYAACICRVCLPAQLPMCENTLCCFPGAITSLTPLPAQPC